MGNVGSRMSPGDLLPPKPRREIFVRHTVGLADPLTEGDIEEADQCDDGLPQSLAASIQVYDLRYFKIKLCGDADRDIDRLRQVAEIIQHATDRETRADDSLRRDDVHRSTLLRMMQPRGLSGRYK